MKGSFYLKGKGSVMARKDIIVDLNNQTEAAKSAKEVNDLVDKGWNQKVLVIPKKEGDDAPILCNIMTTNGKKKKEK